jgi:hypothetical protein
MSHTRGGIQLRGHGWVTSDGRGDECDKKTLPLHLYNHKRDDTSHHFFHPPHPPTAMFLPSGLMRKTLQRKGETPWEVVDRQEVSPVPMYDEDDGELILCALHFAELIA